MTNNVSNSLKGKVFSGLAWVFGERVTAQLVSFAISVILARMLAPSEYGIITMVLVFINIANVFTNGGFGEALVQKKDSTEKDFNTVFYCTFVISICVYILMFFVAPYIAHFYKTEQITWVLRILALKIVISSVATIQHAYVQKHMIFKKFFYSAIGGSLLSGIIGIVFAKMGFGVWALVAQYLSNTVISMIVMLFVVPWKPRWMFSKVSAKGLMALGWKLVAANLVNAIYNELRSLLIGKKYSSSDLAFYNRGNQIPSLLIANIDTAIGKVVFPAMTTAESIDRLKAIGRRSIKTTTYLIFPTMVGMIIVAPSLIHILLTDTWSGAVIYMQILCIYWMTQPIQTTNWQIIKAMGRGDLCLKLELLKKIIGVILIVVSMNISVRCIAVSAAVHGIISMVINMIPNRKLINYSIKEQIYDIFPAVCASLVMGVGIYFLSSVIFNPIALIILQVCLGTVMYLAISVIFKLEAFYYLFNSFLKKVGK